MKNIIVLKTENITQIENVKKLLLDISEMEYETVLVIAIKDSKWEVFQSAAGISVFRLVGIIETIKQKVLNWNFE